MDRPKHYGMTGGSLAREQELMRSLQILMERVEKGQFAMPGELPSANQWHLGHNMPLPPSLVNTDIQYRLLRSYGYRLEHRKN